LLTMTTEQLIAQLGASAIFAIAIVILAQKFYGHYESEIAYLRAKVDTLEAELIQVKKMLLEQRFVDRQ
jgi:hypothetical protein